MLESIYLLGFVLVYEFGYHVARRKRAARASYQRALEESRALQRQLVVIGDPDNGLRSWLTGRDYGCGDVCIDLTGCPKCPQGIKGDALEVVAQMATDSAVVFVAYVFEYVDDPAALLRECNRVSGSRTYFVTVSRWSPAAYLHGHAKWAYINSSFVRVRPRALWR